MRRDSIGIIAYYEVVFKDESYPFDHMFHTDDFKSKTKLKKDIEDKGIGVEEMITHHM